MAEFKTREGAIKLGIFLAGKYEEPSEIEKIIRLLPEPVKSEIGRPHNKAIDAYEFINSAGERVEIGIGKIRNGFDLWLLYENNTCYKV